jgi:hypothetical protein
MSLKITIMKKIMSIWLLMFAVTMGMAQDGKNEQSAVSIYKGPVRITRVEGKVIVDEKGNPSVKLEIQLMNSADRAESISFGLPGTEPQKISVEPKQPQVISVTPAIEVTGRDQPTRSVRLDLSPSINGGVPDARIEEVVLQLELPSNIKLIRSNKPLQVEQSSGNSIYRLQQSKVYLTNWTLVFNTEGLAVSIDKKISPARIEKGEVTVTLKVTNTGIGALKEIILEDNFDSRDFSGEGNEFSTYQGKENDSRLIWKRTIPSLSPGESVSISFKINAKLPVRKTSLTAAKATVKGTLVGVSNKILLD